MSLTYHQEGDYLMPDLIPPASPTIGKFGMLRREFLRQHRRPIYSGMLMSDGVSENCAAFKSR